MRCVILNRFGAPAEVLGPGEQPTPQPGPGQVRIRMIQSPIHSCHATSESTVPLSRKAVRSAVRVRARNNGRAMTNGATLAASFLDRAVIVEAGGMAFYTPRRHLDECSGGRGAASS